MKLHLLLTPLFLFTSCYAALDGDQTVINSNNNKVKNDLHINAIINNHDKPNLLEAHDKHFKGDSLAYVTPWNNRGNN